MECFDGDVNRMVCGVMRMVVWYWIGLGRRDRIGGDGGDVKLSLGDCVWCVLLPEFVANATASSKSTPPVSHN